MLYSRYQSDVIVMLKYIKIYFIINQFRVLFLTIIPTVIMKHVFSILFEFDAEENSDYDYYYSY